MLIITSILGAIQGTARFCFWLASDIYVFAQAGFVFCNIQFRRSLLGNLAEYAHTYGSVNLLSYNSILAKRRIGFKPQIVFLCKMCPELLTCVNQTRPGH